MVEWEAVIESAAKGVLLTERLEHHTALAKLH